MEQLSKSEIDSYFGIVADNLAINLGENALPYAHIALAKMRALGDCEGLNIWIEIEKRLSLKQEATAQTLH